MTRITVAATQAGSTLFNTPRSLATAEKFLREATSAGAFLVVLPEAFLGGHPKGLDSAVPSVPARPRGGKPSAATPNRPLAFPDPKPTGLLSSRPSWVRSSSRPPSKVMVRRCRRYTRR
ncbi:nitrilase-related carbon-nitrogen hydrolase [Psychromicrobium xiongbiense]|uniref:nitrilase-related carbon-nitrogen hydrolase n=1 Tax=Psychromicrobium xiongbiense TaxID=3051184 RepID=UPI003B228317